MECEKLEIEMGASSKENHLSPFMEQLRNDIITMFSRSLERFKSYIYLVGLVRNSPVWQSMRDTYGRSSSSDGDVPEG